MREHAGSAAKPLVGLFLLLLVFFVLLTAGAPIDPFRSRIATDSLAAAFPIGPTWLSGEEGAAGAGGERSGIVLQQRLIRLFATDLAVARIEITERGHVMQAQFPIAALFDGDAVRPALLPLLQRIGQELGAVHHGSQAGVDLFFPAPEPSAAARGAAFAQAMIDRGAPADSVRIGMERGMPGQVRLEFSLRRRDPASHAFIAG